MTTEETTVEQNGIQVSAPKKSRTAWPIIIAITAILVLAWIIVRPGVFTIQPIGVLPDGVTIIYHSRNPEMPFFSSLDNMCLEMQGGVSILCRGAALSAATELSDRIILRLPYSRWAYLQSTGGLEFDR